MLIFSSPSALQDESFTFPNVLFFLCFWLSSHLAEVMSAWVCVLVSALFAHSKRKMLTISTYICHISTRGRNATSPWNEGSSLTGAQEQTIAVSLQQSDKILSKNLGLTFYKTIENGSNLNFSQYKCILQGSKVRCYSVWRPGFHSSLGQSLPEWPEARLFKRVHFHICKRRELD